MLMYESFIKKIKLCDLRVQGSIGSFCPDGSRASCRALCNVSNFYPSTNCK